MKKKYLLAVLVAVSALALVLSACSKVDYLSAGRLSTLADNGVLEPTMDDEVCVVNCEDPDDPDDPGDPEDPNDNPLGKVKICHVPPGQPEQARVMLLPQQAVRAHLEHSGESLDYLIPGDSDLMKGDPCDPYAGINQEQQLL